MLHFILHLVYRTTHNQTLSAGCLVALTLMGNVWNASSVHAQASITLEFVDDESGEPIASRVYWTRSGKRLTRDKKILSVGDYWLAEQSIPLRPPLGDFEFLAQRGPEFTEIRGGFTVERNAKDSVLVEIPRSIDMHAEHWYSGDHGTALPIEEFSRWQVADAIDMVVSHEFSKPKAVAKPKPKPSKDKDKARGKDTDEVMEDEPVVDAAELHGLKLNTLSRAYQLPSIGITLHGLPPLEPAPRDPNTKIEPLNPLDVYKQFDDAREQTQVIAEITQAWSRDVPILLADDSVRCVQLLSNVNRPFSDDKISFPTDKPDSNKDPQATSLEFGRITLTTILARPVSPIYAPINPKDRIRYKDARGVGRMAEFLYWQMLEAGLRMTPTASTGFGRGETHAGYNRVYAYCDSNMDAQQWWQSIKRGATTVTNGPLLRVRVNGMPPGAVIPSYRGEPIELDIEASLAVREPVDYLDVIINGETIYSAKLEDHYKRGEFPPIEVDKSSWMVTRVVTSHEDGYRFATTAPFYFEFDGKPRISKKATEFFVKWLENSKQSIAQESTHADGYKELIEKAERFWQRQLENSNAP